MAGIGFELRKILKEDRLLSLAKVYGYSAILSSGPWVISIIAILLVGFVSIANYGPNSDVYRFQVVITYAIALASSLIITGIIQLPFTRYIADLVFKHKEDEILPSFFGAIFLAWILGLPFIVPFYLWMFEGESLVFIMGTIATFLVLCAVWIASILAASLKYYKGVVWSYFISYTLIVITSIFFGDSIEKLIYIFFIGNALLLVALMTLIIKSYNATIFLKVDFFLAKNFYWSLAFAGLFYNLGAWIDKIIFWYNPATGYAVLGRLHASIVYDMPIFLAYLSILPGMAIFFFRLEADFAEKYELYYDAVRNGGSLKLIRIYRDEMVNIIRHAMHEIIIIQGIVDIMLFLTAPQIFAALNIPQLYLGLFYILTIGAMLQLAFMSVLAILYYLDRKKVAMWLSIAFFILNALLTLLSIDIGPAMYGYGYAVSLLIVFTASILVLRNQMERLNYETFMLQ
ncbi:exopolysaccharide Pel transporter PelG [Sulfurimonas paralvinellae]|uniref:Histidine kinase n=1 Tax=Sulfurimonas paralvinellae TaxID=317658 RepID=A0A7M1B5B1_9BACT|nr:exopolysaccharide Pel transporter PelG [Sulfurimonas paralvinellae]QOP44914.1 histidine kinase [Sulfurimonas paralvinellae]